MANDPLNAASRRFILGWSLTLDREASRAYWRSPSGDIEDTEFGGASDVMAILSINLDKREEESATVFFLSDEEEE